jgi:hypothetical protein
MLLKIINPFRAINNVRCLEHNLFATSVHYISEYSHVPHNDVSVNDGPHIRRWSLKIIILQCNTTVLQLPTVFSTVTCCTGL